MPTITRMCGFIAMKYTHLTKTSGTHLPGFKLMDAEAQNGAEMGGKTREKREIG